LLRKKLIEESIENKWTSKDIRTEGSVRYDYNSFFGSFHSMKFFHTVKIGSIQQFQRPFNAYQNERLSSLWQWENFSHWKDLIEELFSDLFIIYVLFGPETVKNRQNFDKIILNNHSIKISGSV